jgi:hypothetical protein
MLKNAKNVKITKDSLSACWAGLPLQEQVKL